MKAPKQFTTFTLALLWIACTEQQEHNPREVSHKPPTCCRLGYVKLNGEKRL